MPACTFPRLNSCLNAGGNIVVTVPWALASGQAGFGVGGVTQSGTATYTIAVNANSVDDLQGLCDECDDLAAEQIAVVT